MTWHVWREVGLGVLSSGKGLSTTWVFERFETQGYYCAEALSEDRYTKDTMVATDRLNCKQLSAVGAGDVRSRLPTNLGHRGKIL